MFSLTSYVLHDVWMRKVMVERSTYSILVLYLCCNNRGKLNRAQNPSEDRGLNVLVCNINYTNYLTFGGVFNHFLEVFLTTLSS